MWGKLQKASRRMWIGRATTPIKWMKMLMKYCKPSTPCPKLRIFKWKSLIFEFVQIIIIFFLSLKAITSLFLWFAAFFSLSRRIGPHCPLGSCNMSQSTYLSPLWSSSPQHKLCSFRTSRKILSNYHICSNHSLSVPNLALCIWCWAHHVQHHESPSTFLYLCSSYSW